MRSVKGSVWTITTDRIRLHWIGTASGLQIIKTEPLTQLFFASSNTSTSSYWDFSFPIPKGESMESQKQEKWPTITKMEKLAGMWRKEKLGDLFQTYMKHFPKNLFPNIVAFYTFQATCSALTINSFPLLILFDFHWETQPVILQELTRHHQSFSQLWPLIEKMSENFCLYLSISCIAQFHILGIYSAIFCIEGGKNPKPAPNQNPVVWNNWPITQLLQKNKFHVCVTVIAQTTE